jgi:hypothetical protein
LKGTSPHEEVINRDIMPEIVLTNVLFKLQVRLRLRENNKEAEGMNH